MDTDELIAATMRRVAASATPPPRAPVAAPTRPRWIAMAGVAAVAATVAVLVTVASLVGAHRSEGGPTTGPTSTGPSPTYAGCRSDYPPTPLPPWARTGFTPPAQPVPHVLGDRGDMVAVVWATHQPLLAPPGGRAANKILWVARVGAADGPLRITATLASTGQTVTRTVEAAPGPSTIDLPAAGCWSFDLRWGNHRDHLALGYAPR